MTDASTGLLAVLADGLAALVNASLDLDPASRARIAALEGYRVQITADAPAPVGARHFSLSVAAGRLRLHAGALERPNVIVRGAPWDLAAWLFAGAGASGSRLVIDGDGTVVQELTAVLRAFRPDLGVPLERLLGPDLAGSTIGSVELALAGLRSAFDAAGSGVRQSAARNFVDRARMERFLDDVDDLRLRIDRLAARVQAQEQRQATRSGGGEPS